ncbi:MAG: AAA family ATPase, partial [Blastocatellia bacterium]
FWDRIALTSLEAEVVDALRIIESDIERLNLLSDAGRENETERVPKVKLRGEDEPVLLRSLGDGMNRLFGIALALANAKAGVLLIDEIENGLHYSVQKDVWRLVFETATRLDVQVFATTHSLDCISAFQCAAVESKEEAMLVRLQEKNGETTATLFDRRRLGIATQEVIEIR